MLSEIITASVVVGLVSVVMGFVLVAIEKLVNNYGDLQLSINQGKKLFDLKGGNKLLSSLADQQIYLPSACGGRGSCGACKCQVNTDIGPHLPTELPWLTPAEVAEGVHLACQVKVKKNLDLRIPDELFSIRRLSATVSRITDLTYDIKEVELSLPAGTKLDYFAGQYGQIEIPAYGDIRESTQRAYSFSSNPQRPDCLEFIIKLVPGGAVTTYVHKFLKVGQTLTVVAPIGDFQVKGTGATMVCLAGGSGMAPFKSIFNDMEIRGELDTRDIWYFFCAHANEDMYHLDWLNGLQNRHPRFHFVPSLSTPNPALVWPGETGRVTAILDRYLKEKIPLGEKPEAYLCGSPGLLDSCMDVMAANGIARPDMYFDKFA